MLSIWQLASLLVDTIVAQVQNAASNTVRECAGIQCTFKNMDFLEFKDIDGARVSKASAEQCADLCIDTPGCTVAVFNMERQL